jgi:cell division protein FtsQ
MQLPWSGRSVIRLPVFTNFPAEKTRLYGSDSVLLQQVKTLGWYILKDTFWMAAIEQVNITADRRFQMVPVIGNHIVEFGDGNDYEQKFRRLLVFYREVSGKTGFDKYSIVDVQYAGQVIGTRKGSNISRFDSLLAAKNILQLIRSAQQLQGDTVKQQNIKPLEHNTMTEQTLTNYDLIPVDSEEVRSTK